MTNVCDGINPVTDPLVNAVGYGLEPRTFRVYSEDVGLIGLRDFTVQALLEEYT